MQRGGRSRHSFDGFLASDSSQRHPRLSLALAVCAAGFFRGVFHPIFRKEFSMPLFPSNKTASYTASVNELVRADCSAGSFTVTLPASPSANDQVGVFLRDTNAGTT